MCVREQVSMGCVCESRSVWRCVCVPLCLLTFHMSLYVPEDSICPFISPNVPYVSLCLQTLHMSFYVPERSLCPFMSHVPLPLTNATHALRGLRSASVILVVVRSILTFSSLEKLLSHLLNNAIPMG